MPANCSKFPERNGDNSISSPHRVETLSYWLQKIKPKITEVGADNYNNHLSDPPWWKVEKVLQNLRYLCPTVVEDEVLGD